MTHVEYILYFMHKTCFCFILKIFLSTLHCVAMMLMIHNLLKIPWILINLACFNNFKFCFLFAQQKNFSGIPWACEIRQEISVIKQVSENRLEKKVEVKIRVAGERAKNKLYKCQVCVLDKIFLLAWIC